MEALGSLFGGLGNVNMSTLLKFTDLDAHIKKHLAKVYATLLFATLMLGIGAALDMTYHISGVLTGLGAFGGVVALAVLQPTPGNLRKRYAALGVVGLCKGAMIGPLCRYAVAVDPSLLVAAFLSTSAIFGCFTLSALTTRRRSLLFLSSMLGSVLMAMLVINLCGFFFGRMLSFKTELYLGLMVFSGYVLVDTQVIVEKAAAGYTDHINDALLLFTDLVAIFVRILIILTTKADEERQRKEKEARRKERRD